VYPKLKERKILQQPAVACTGRVLRVFDDNPKSWFGRRAEFNSMFSELSPKFRMHFLKENGEEIEVKIWHREQFLLVHRGDEGTFFYHEYKRKLYFGSLGDKWEYVPINHKVTPETTSVDAPASKIPFEDVLDLDFSGLSSIETTSLIREQIVKIWESVDAGGGTFKNFFVFDEIKQKTLKNAKRSYANSLGEDGDEEVILLYDSTLFRTGKTGFILTSKCIYYKEMMEPVEIAYLEHVHNIRFVNESKLKYRIVLEMNTEPNFIIKIDEVDEERVQDASIGHALREIIRLLKAIPPKKSDLPTTETTRPVKQQIEEIWESVDAGGGTFKKFFVLKEIRHKTLKNAKRSYAQTLGDDSDEKVILLYDSTLFRTGKTGFILTSKCLYCKEMMEPAETTYLENIRDLTIVNKSKLQYHIVIEMDTGANVIIKIDEVDEERVENASVGHALKEIVHLLKAAND